MVYLAKRSFGHHTAVVITPSPQYGVKVFYQILLRCRLVLSQDDLMQLFSEPFQAFGGWLDKQCAVVFADIEPQKVEALIDVRYQCLFFGKGESTLPKKPD